MRFALSLCLALACTAPSVAAPGDSVKLNDMTARRAPMPLGKQLRTSSSGLQTIDGMALTEAAKGLGQVSAIALAQDGTLYAAEGKRGRIWQLTDRNQDGTFEHRRPLPQSFDHPSAIAVIGETLYVADRAALWAIKPLAPKQQLASLANAQSADQKYLLTAQDGQLILGLNTSGHQARLINVNIETGQAQLISSDTGTLTAIAGRGVQTLRLGLQSKISRPNTPSRTETGTGTTLTGLLLPAYSGTVKNWPGRLDNHIIAAQAGPGAMRLLAIPTEFGQTADQAFVLVDGFMTRSGRNAWGRPGAMVMDQRGLFFLDKWNGSIWHLSGRKSPITKTIVPLKSKNERPEKIAKSEETPKASPLLQGSGITTASQIGTASTITVGSVLKKDYEDKKRKIREEKKREKDNLTSPDE